MWMGKDLEPWDYQGRTPEQVEGDGYIAFWLCAAAIGVAVFICLAALAGWITVSQGGPQ